MPGSSARVQTPLPEKSVLDAGSPRYEELLHESVYAALRRLN
jgi:hypothetical protein